MNREDVALLEEIYRGIKEESLLEESLLGYIIDDVRKRMKWPGGIKKVDIVHYLRLIKSKSQEFYAGVMDRVKEKLFVTKTVGGLTDKDKYDHPADLVILLLMSLLAFPLSVGIVLSADKALSNEKVIEWINTHKESMVKKINEIEKGVELDKPNR